MLEKKFNPLGKEEVYDKTPSQKKLDERIARVADDQRKVGKDEIIVPANESEKLQKSGHQVIAMFNEGGAFMHKLRKPKEDKK